MDSRFSSAPSSTFNMLAQKLSRITLKMSDLKEYEEVKQKRKEAEKQSKGPVLEQRAVHRIMNDSVTKKSPRKALNFDVCSSTPGRTSTPDED